MPLTRSARAVSVPGLDDRVQPRPTQRSQSFLLLYALAYGGGVIAYVPLLTLLLPLKVEGVALDDKVALLSLVTIVGAMVASVANIVAGMLSDRAVDGPFGRRPWIWGGLVATLVSYALLYFSRTPAMLVVSVVIFQVALNFILAPLIAIAADEVPDAQKGMVGGLFGAVYPLGALVGILVTAWPAFTEGTQLFVVGGLVLSAALPFLIVMRRRGTLLAAAEVAPTGRARNRRNLTLIWLARLLVQTAGNVMFAYFLYYFQTVDQGGQSISPRELAGKISWLSGAVAVIGIPLAVFMGRASDMVGHRKPFLVATTVMMTGGLLILAVLPQWVPAAFGYVLFSSGFGVFLALQNAYAMQMLPSPAHRGRDLGILNLTNTVPAVAAPSLAYALITLSGFAPLLATLAAFTAIAGVLTLLVRDSL